MYVETKILTNNDIDQALTKILRHHKLDTWSFNTLYYSKEPLNVGDLVVINIKRQKLNRSENRLAIVSVCHDSTYIPDVLTKPIIAKIDINHQIPQQWQNQKAIYSLRHTQDISYTPSH